MEVQGIYALSDTEELSRGDDHTLSREDHKDSRLGDQTLMNWLLGDTCSGYKREQMSIRAWM